MTALSLESSRSSRGIPAARPPIARFAFGGVGVELLSVPGTRALFAGLSRFAEAASDNGDIGTVARVVCSAVVDHGLRRSQPETGALQTELHRSAARATLRGRGVQVELRRTAHARYAGSIRIAPNPEAAAQAMRVLVTAVAHLEGGALMHGVGVELDGEALLLVGPSGAGKTTACDLMRDARCFANDHVVVVPTRGGWVAWGMPGGSPAHVPASNATHFPLRAVLRVMRGRPQTTLARLSPAEGLFAVRENTKVADFGGKTEEQLMDMASRLCADVFVGALHTVLGQRIEAALDHDGGISLRPAAVGAP